MLSKNWKFVLIATLSATFVACGNQKTDSSTNGSVYSGVWMNKVAHDNFVRNQRSTRNFCRVAKTKRRDHGLPLSGAMLPFFVPAVSIENNGEVRRLEPIPRSTTAAQGYVDYNGLFTSRDNSLNTLMASNSQLGVSAGQLTVSTITSYGINRPARALVSVTRDEAVAFIEKMKVCIWGRSSEMVDDDWSNGGYHGKAAPRVSDDELDQIDKDYGWDLDQES